MNHQAGEGEQVSVVVVVLQEEGWGGIGEDLRRTLQAISLRNLRDTLL